MKIAIISDSHENSSNLEKTIKWLNENKIEILIHCGDVSRIEMLGKMNQDFEGQVHLVWGNCDQGFFDNLDETRFEKIRFYGEIGEIEVENKKIAWVHYPRVARDMAKQGKYDLIFYGHTHKPWEEKIGECLLLNPGNLAGMWYRATFAVYDFETGKAELKILDKM